MLIATTIWAARVSTDEGPDLLLNTPTVSRSS
jgi:hypothetical protein